MFMVQELYILKRSYSVMTNLKNNYENPYCLIFLVLPADILAHWDKDLHL